MSTLIDTVTKKELIEFLNKLPDDAVLSVTDSSYYEATIHFNLEAQDKDTQGNYEFIHIEAKP